MIITRGKRLIYGLALLIAALFVFELSPIDIWVQNALYDGNVNLWLWNKSDPVGRLFFYDGPKRVLIAFALSLMAALGWSYYSGKYRHLRSGIRVAVLTIILVPLIVASLKAVTNVACPKDLLLYGGNIPFVDVFQQYPLGERPTSLQRCFPAGHASGFFALMALSYCFTSHRTKASVIGLAILIGWIVGLYKMMIGDHFLSHTFVSMMVAWVVMCGLGLIEAALSNRSVQVAGEPSINRFSRDE